MDMSVVTKMRRRCVEVGKDGMILFSGLAPDGEPFEIRITILAKSGKRARMLLEAPQEIRIEQLG